MSVRERSEHGLCNDAGCAFKFGSERAIVDGSHECRNESGEYNGNQYPRRVCVRELLRHEAGIIRQPTPFGRIFYVTKRAKLWKKFIDKSTKCICLSNAKDHAADVYRVYNTVTNSTQFSRDSKWAVWHGSQSPTKNITEIVARDVARANGPESEVQDLEVAADNNLPNIISDSEDDDSENDQVAGAGIAAPGGVTSAVAPNCRLPEMAWQLDSGPQIWGGMVEESLLHLVRQLRSYRVHRKCLLQGRCAL